MELSVRVKIWKIYFALKTVFKRYSEELKCILEDAKIGQNPIKVHIELLWPC
jgi:hypothetical protein